VTTPNDSTILGRALLKGAVQQQIFCPYTSKILDVRDAVLIDGSGHGHATLIMTGAAYDIVADQFFASTAVRTSTCTTAANSTADGVTAIFVRAIAPQIQTADRKILVRPAAPETPISPRRPATPPPSACTAT
jgi:hypothetical protein